MSPPEGSRCTHYLGMKVARGILRHWTLLLQIFLRLLRKKLIQTTFLNGRRLLQRLKITYTKLSGKLSKQWKYFFPSTLNTVLLRTPINTSLCRSWGSECARHDMYWTQGDRPTTPLYHSPHPYSVGGDCSNSPGARWCRLRIGNWQHRESRQVQYKFGATGWNSIWRTVWSAQCQNSHAKWYKHVGERVTDSAWRWHWDSASRWKRACKAHGRKLGNIPRRNTVAKGSRTWKVFVLLGNDTRIPRKPVGWAGGEGGKTVIPSLPGKNFKHPRQVGKYFSF